MIETSVIAYNGVSGATQRRQSVLPPARAIRAALIAQTR